MTIFTTSKITVVYTCNYYLLGHHSHFLPLPPALVAQEEEDVAPPAGWVVEREWLDEVGEAVLFCEISLVCQCLSCHHHRTGLPVARPFPCTLPKGITGVFSRIQDFLQVPYVVFLS